MNNETTSDNTNTNGETKTVKTGFVMRAGENILKRVEITTLEDMQKAVGGYIEAIPVCIGGRITAYCNEEGKLMNLPYNRTATAMLNKKGFRDCLVGDILFTVTDENGDTQSIGEEEQAVLFALRTVTVGESEESEAEDEDGDGVEGDIRKVIRALDEFADMMFDRGAFNPNESEDEKEFSDFIEAMKKKYMVD